MCERGKSILEESVILENIKNQLSVYEPDKIILFGSRAKGTANPESDYDICVIAQCENKRDTLTDMYCSLDHVVPIDLLLYTPQEWRKWINDSGSLISLINREGKLLYG